MQIKSKQIFNRQCCEELCSYVERNMNVEGYDEDEISSLGRTSNNTVIAIAKLLEKLAEKGIISAPEITEIVGRYQFDAEFVEEE